MSRKYDPSQPRVPAGHSTGGQWTSDASIADNAARKGAGLPPNTIYDNENMTISAKWAIYKNKVVTGTVFDQHNRMAHDLGLDSEDDFDARGITGLWHSRTHVFQFIGVYDTKGAVYLVTKKFNKLLDDLGFYDETPLLYTTPDIYQYHFLNPRIL